MLLGPFGAHEVLEVTLAQDDTGPQDQLPYLGVEPQISSQAFPGGLGLEHFHRGPCAILGGRDAWNTQDQGQNQAGIHGALVCGGIGTYPCFSCSIPKTRQMIKEVVAQKPDGPRRWNTLARKKGRRNGTQRPSSL